MFGAELETVEREVWYVVVELHTRDDDGGGFVTERTAYSDIGSAQMMCDTYDHNPKAWPNVRRAWVECGTRTETRTAGGRIW